MTIVEAPQPSEAQTPALPDYMTDPNAVLKDTDASWRYGKPPDYTNTRRVFAESKHARSSSPSTPDSVLIYVHSQEMQP